MDHRGNEKEAGYTDLAQISTPGSNPSSGYDRLYFKSDNNLYRLTSGGAEAQVGGASGGGSDPSATLVQVVAPTNGSSSSPQTLTFGVAPTNGNLLLLFFSSSNVAALPIVITQTGVTWNHFALAELASGAEVFTDCWYGVVGAGAGTSMSISFSNFSSGNTWYAMELTGLTNSLVDSATSTAFGSNSNTYGNVQNLAAFHPGGSYYLVGYTQGNSPAMGILSKWTLETSMPFAPGTGHFFAAHYHAKSDSPIGTGAFVNYTGLSNNLASVLFHVS